VTDKLDIRTVNVTRYVTPLREGGSLPAIVEADDGFLYVLKFRGAGQGKKALIAEFVGGEVARAAGLKVPEIVFANLDEAFGRIEGDEEIQDLLKASTGINLAVHYLSGAITFDPLVVKISSELASKIVWLDAFLMNVDRTFKNTNMLWWKKELWAIDHGACMYFHHGVDPSKEAAERPFSYIKEHVLLSHASRLDQVNEEVVSMLNIRTFTKIIEAIPDALLEDRESGSFAEQRNAYREFLEARLLNSRQFVNEVHDARKAVV
jgi:hypothetical protein